MNIDAALAKVRAGKIRQRIYKVGIELEGGWKKAPPGGAIQRDGSVRFPGAPRGGAEVIVEWRVDLNGNRVPRAVRPPPAAPGEEGVPAYVGELPSEPLTLAEMEPWMKANYPTHVNATCGMHCHMSFNSAFTYQRLMVPEYTAVVVDYISKWATDNLPKDHHIWPRLQGNSEFCQHKFYADKQARQMNKDFEHFRDGCRYTVINYCYSRHQTAECRLLPMMPTVALGISALNELFYITNAFLAATAAREPKHSIHVIMEGDAIPEEIVECV